MQRLFGKLQFDFMPETFIIPDQLEAFIQVYEKTDCLWIVKPHASTTIFDDPSWHRSRYYDKVARSLHYKLGAGSRCVDRLFLTAGPDNYFRLRRRPWNGFLCFSLRQPRAGNFHFARIERDTSGLPNSDLSVRRITVPYPGVEVRPPLICFGTSFLDTISCKIDFFCVSGHTHCPGRDHLCLSERSMSLSEVVHKPIGYWV